jgi:FAD:protein FMN transferase
VKNPAITWNLSESPGLHENSRVGPGGVPQELTEYRVVDKLMGSVFELIVMARDGRDADHYLRAGLHEIQRLEELLSEFRNTSEISLVNRNAGVGPVKVSGEVFELLARCKQLHTVTQGAFDITIGPLKSLYNFKNQDFTYPSQKKIKQTLELVGADKMELPGRNTVFLPRPGMKISLAAIGKGYAADCVKKKWMDMGVQSGVINASGDLTVIGLKPGNKPWVAGIPEPGNNRKIYCYVPLRNKAIATSGDDIQFFIRNGKRYAHTIDPKNGLPLSGIKSVSVVSNSGELCDALATAVYVMGTRVGLNFIRQVPGAYCLIIDENNDVFVSENLEIIQS